MRHRPALLLTLLALGAGSTAAPTASAQPAPPIAWEPGVPSHQPAGLPDAELFATNNTAVITDPDDPRLDAPLDGFARKVERIIRQGGGEPRATQLLDGVLFSSDLGTTTFERSRDFDVDGVTTQELHDIAERVRTRFDQQSVLTFDYLAPLAPQVDAVEVEVPGVDVVALRDALVADPVAQARLFRRLGDPRRAAPAGRRRGRLHARAGLRRPGRRRLGGRRGALRRPRVRRLVVRLGCGTGH